MERGDENRKTGVLAGRKPEIPGIAQAQEVQAEARRRKEQQEGDHVETGGPRPAGEQEKDGSQRRRASFEPAITAIATRTPKEWLVIGPYRRSDGCSKYGITTYVSAGTILPSRMRMIRWARADTVSEWVTTRIVLP